MAKVSVIIPSLNVAPYIKECLDSVINQTLSDIEIICIDAGSTDGTEEIIKEYEKKDSRITFVHSSIKSYGYQVNYGIGISHGEYVAILESDDFVNNRMYEDLYKLAVSNDLDYIKADYDSFFYLSNGEKMYVKTSIFSGEYEDFYNKIINPRDVELLWYKDFFLWKGIYKRSFLVKNDIRLNETPGAAFQDIGFSQQVLSYAKKAMYTDASYYRYRTDRDQSSSFSLRILEYGCGEFKRILSMYEDGKPLFYKGIFTHMIIAARSELYYILPKVGYDYDNEHIRVYYDWYMEKLKKALEDKVFALDELVVKWPYDRFMNGEKSQRDNINEINNANNRIPNEIFKRCSSTENIVIFGSGKRGKTYLKLLDGKCNLVGFVDNSEDKQGTKFYGYHVMSLEDCIKLYPQCKYVIANKYFSKDITKQLVNIGVEEDRIICID